MKSLIQFINEKRIVINDDKLSIGPNLIDKQDLIKTFTDYFINKDMFTIKLLNQQSKYDWRSYDDYYGTSDEVSSQDKLQIDINEKTREVILNNVESIKVNIESGLNKYYSPYKILLPEGATVFIRDSASKARNISEVKSAFLSVFSENNKFECVTLVYISLDDSDLGDDFLDKIYTNNLVFDKCKKFKSMTIDNSTFKNPNTQLHNDTHKTFAAHVQKQNEIMELKRERKEKIEASKQNPLSLNFSGVKYKLTEYDKTFYVGVTGHDADLKDFYYNNKFIKDYYYEIDDCVGQLIYMDNWWGEGMPHHFMLKFEK